MVHKSIFSHYNILQSKKNLHLTQQLNQNAEGSVEKKNLITQLQDEVSSLQQQASDTDSEHKRARNELATCRQKIKSLDEEI